MRKVFLLTFLIFTFILVPAIPAFAQGMMGFPSASSDNATIQSQQQEEQEGKKFLDNLNNKTVICSQLKDADFGKIGEYFMGQSIGDTSRHIAMNEMMKSMMGEQGEEQMHIAWGKRGSGCDASAAFPSQGTGFMPMMQMMMGGGGNSMMGYSGWGNMMTGWGGFIVLFFTLSLIVWLIVGILAAVWLFRQINKK